jgi:hypothetical protein
MVRAFSEAKIQADGQLKVKGPFDPEGMDVKLMRFVVTQGNVMVEGDNHHAGPGGTWDGFAPAQGLQAGPAYGFAMAVLMKPDPPTRFETVTWGEPITITK